MNNIINRINNEFNFNYQKFVKNNSIAETNLIKQNNETSKTLKDYKPAEIETMDFDEPKPKKEEPEILDLDE